MGDARRAATRRLRLATASLVAIALVAPLTACSSEPAFYAANRTDRPLTLWMGNRKIGPTIPGMPWHRDSIILPNTGIDSQLRALSEDGSSVALIDPPVGEGDLVVVRNEDLVPATATATVVNDGDGAVWVQVATEDMAELARGERREVALGVPAGGCLEYAEDQGLDTWRVGPPVPASWHGRICDGDVLGLSGSSESEGAATLLVQNATDVAVEVRDGTVPLDRIDPGVTGEVPSPTGGCTDAALTVASLEDPRVQVLPAPVCPGETVVVDLLTTATVVLDNGTDAVVFGELDGTAHANVAVDAGARETVYLGLPVGGCDRVVLRMISAGALRVQDWSGEVCDGDRLSLSDAGPPATDPGSPQGVPSVSWTLERASAG